MAIAPVEIPQHDDAIERVVKQCRRLVRQRALIAAGVAMVPLPGVDWVTDVGILVKLLPRISASFGLAPEQVERLAPERKVVVFKVLSATGSLVLGRAVTRTVVLQLLKLVGVRLTTQQATKWLPVAGQAVSAALTYSALQYVCEQHIQQCAAVARQLALPAPAQPLEALPQGPAR
ncbi:protein of unknown function (DUF697) [Burkholderiales bacterium JOSHI_001]|nr:protein of unknown function (DUF697) [Burkholderiales bacterium JOSHI_001]